MNFTTVKIFQSTESDLLEIFFYLIQDESKTFFPTLFFIKMFFD